MHDSDHISDVHPRPWRQVRVRSGVVIKDAVGSTVLLLPFTGRLSEERKARTAALILEAVNGCPDRPQAVLRRPLPQALTASLRPPRRERVDPGGVGR